MWVLGHGLDGEGLPVGVPLVRPGRVVDQFVTPDSVVLDGVELAVRLGLGGDVSFRPESEAGAPR